MRVQPRTLALAIGLGALAAAGLFAGCSAGVNNAAGGSGGAGTGSTGTQNGTTGSTGTGAPTSSSTGFATGSGGAGGGVDVPMNPCGTKCGPMELCDGVNKGIDDNCTGTVDDGCPCSPGEAEPCFKGDPSYLNTPGCFPGTQKCSENGVWGVCTGGSHATDNCFMANPDNCHPISSVPFATVDLKSGTGSFSNNADPGSSDWTLDCPMGVSPCPTPDSMGNVQVLVSGEYTVHYTKTVNGMPEMCDYPLYVGAPGLRVELSWDFPSSGGSTDLDLHMHEPGTTTPWGQGANQDCGYSNCTVDNFNPIFPFGPEWFPPAPQPPGMPVNWDLNPMMNLNTCYYAPRGVGMQWQGYGQGCHNPRLDLDDISCNPSITDPQDLNFCAPENTNVDIPPQDKWIRIGVHYYPGTSTYTGIIHPNVKIYCEGHLAAELGAHGFFNPETPIAWPFSQVDQFWSVADVRFHKDQCSNLCEVKPIYAGNDTTTRQPVYASESTVSTVFQPPYPP
jgi:hypothetical protein